MRTRDEREGDTDWKTRVTTPARQPGVRQPARNGKSRFGLRIGGNPAWEDATLAFAQEAFPEAHERQLRESTRWEGPSLERLKRNLRNPTERREILARYQRIKKYQPESLELWFPESHNKLVEQELRELDPADAERREHGNRRRPFDVVDRPVFVSDSAKPKASTVRTEEHEHGARRPSGDRHDGNNRQKEIEDKKQTKASRGKNRHEGNNRDREIADKKRTEASRSKKRHEGGNRDAEIADKKKSSTPAQPRKAPTTSKKRHDGGNRDVEIADKKKSSTPKKSKTKGWKSKSRGQNAA